MRELQPLNKNVLLELTKKTGEEKTASGIIIPDTAKNKEAIGKVVAIGTIKKTTLAVGDTVLYKEYSGSEVDFEGKKYLIIPHVDILAKVL
jgi:chaperonin GroES